MNSMLPLVRNEMLKIWKKKRFFVIIGIVAVLIPIFTYAQLRVSLDRQSQMGTDDWRVSLQQRINDYTNRMSSPRVIEEWRKWMSVEVQRLQYYLDHDVNPEEPSGVTFTREFVKNAVGLFVPLLVMVIASDLVSSEHAQGTIKLLLTRPVSRWKVLLSKYLALLLYVSLIVIILAALCYLISGAIFGYGGWQAPTLIGFQITGSDIDTANVNMIEQWRFVWMELGLVFFTGLAVGCIALMVSVLVKSTAAGMGIMLATLIAGTILSNMVSSWESAKYFFMVNLDLVSYLSGDLPPVEGMNLTFSMSVLTVWAVASIVVSFVSFTRRDVY
ncbi:ABC transporter permease [Xylanibacillus composti]|uniref:ABC transporter permease n=1 Tax=Xylanibacillus composti TaxID=1572762 RepID=A0A8J4M111_9BACL|nr:ABC transporter permease [Xylanibacillus composti]MDT9725531.1 ABC transporter permease [Xylanibacillus composti]GIQ67625.1 ABC transporter permease [Xylanibacillus composti]